MTDKDLGLKRKFRTFRFTLEEKELLQNLADIRTETKDRHSALLALVPIVREMKIPVKQEKKKPIRIGIPLDLKDAIEDKVKETGQTFVDILLMAAREYRNRHQLSDSSETSN